MVPTNGDRYKDKFVSPEKPPEGLERELLTILAEECCEVGQRCTKALRFGTQEVQPGQDLTNAERIEVEVGDIFAVLRKMDELGILDPAKMRRLAIKKTPKLERFLQSRGFDNNPPGDEK